MIAAAVGLAACGRIGFDEAIGVGKVGIDAGDPGCTFGPWTLPARQPFDNVNTGDIEWGGQISADGLDLVFSSTRPNLNNPAANGQETIYFAHRAAPGDPFDPPTYPAPIDDAPSDDPRDPTLSADKLELYFVADDRDGHCVYVARRDDTAQAWGTPVKLTALCFTGDLGGPYLSDDGLRLYYDAQTANEQTVSMTTRASRVGDFASRGAPVAGLDSGTGYCALSADELTAVCEVNAPTAGDPEAHAQVWQATRPSRDAPFEGAGPIPELASAYEDGDPSLTADGTQLIYATAATGDNDLRAFVRTCQ